MKKASKGVIVKMNGNQPVQKTPGSKGVKSGVNPKAAASDVAKGRSGGTSVAPKTALPKAQIGGIINMAKKAAKSGKNISKGAGKIVDFRTAASKSDMSEALKRAERAKLKKQLQDIEKGKSKGMYGMSVKKKK
jgi:hypothetical protein